MKTALITGISGQDGQYLSSYLAKEGRAVYGISRKTDYTSTSATVLSVDTRQYDTIASLIGRLKPVEIYHLASPSYSSEEFPSDLTEFLRANYEANMQSTINILEATARNSPSSRVFFASSCQIYGFPTSTPQNEDTATRPSNIYAVSKLAGADLCRMYRQDRNLFASVGILYNHESPLRRPSFLSKKVAKAAAEASKGEPKRIKLGNLETQVDWGFAGDYVVAMSDILALDVADAFVVSSGELHTVKQFVELAFGVVGLDWEKYVEVSPSLLREKHGLPLYGDATRLRRATGWTPRIGFEEMVKMLVEHEVA